MEYQARPDKYITYLQDPVDADGKGTLDKPDPWPTCEQLPCKCLGKEGGLTQQEERNHKITTSDGQFRNQFEQWTLT